MQNRISNKICTHSKNLLDNWLKKVKKIKNVNALQNKSNEFGFNHVLNSANEGPINTTASLSTSVSNQETNFAD